LVERFYDCDEGAVLIDDMDIRDLDLNEIRGHIGYVG
jgi:ATP-binding cassette subfamily B multidrug efflux pump